MINNTRLLALLAAVALVAVACSSDDESSDSDAAETTITEAAADDEPADDEAASNDTDEDDAAEGDAAGEFPSAIVSLSPSATEMVFAIGAGDQVIAVDDFSNYPEAAIEKMVGLSAFDPNVEAIAALEPDLVLTDGTNPDFLAQLDALGTALKQFDSSNRPKMVVFLTDGLPTIGERDINKILANAAEVKVEGLRIFPFGVGYDVNTRLLDKMGTENSGIAEYVEPKEDLEVKVSNFFTKVNSPVLTGIEVDYGSLRPDLIYPKKQGDIFRGSQMTVIGRYKNSSDLENISFVLTGKAGQRTREFRYNNLSFPLRDTKHEFLPRLWATRRVGSLVEEIRSNGDNKELRDEIVKLGTKYGIVTPYTSFLATDGSVSLRAGSPSPARMRASGSLAVQDSKRQNVQKNKANVLSEEDELLSMNTTTNRVVERIGTKTYLLKDGVWVDSQFEQRTGLKTVEIEFGSNEYFELVNKKPEIAVHLSIGKNVDLIWEGVAYKIRE